MDSPFDISSDYVDRLIARSPQYATALGIEGFDHLWGDIGIDGIEARVALATRTRSLLEPGLTHPEAHQRLAARVLSASFDEDVAAFENGDHFYDLRHMASQFQRLRTIFDVMAKGSAIAWENITERLASIDRPLADYQHLLALGAGKGQVVAARQVESVADQAATLASDRSSLLGLGAEADSGGHFSPRLAAAIDHARAAYGAFAAFLRNEYLPKAAATDAVGEERYRRAADRFVGIDVDPYEAYAWGWEELNRLLDQARAVGDHIVAGGSFDEVKQVLETDPDRAAHSPGAFADFILGLQQKALAELDGTHFDVATEIRDVTVTIAPPGGPLAGYYVGPSEDFSRPGGIWFSIGDQTVFPLYHWVSTAYHEGFPGHHLQVGTAMANKDRISRGQRLAIWYPGYGEGWALYAERLMGELGYLEKPDYEFGMLAKHLYRATRVVVDIGLHLELSIPESAPLHGGQPWSFERAVDYMKVYGFRTDAQAPNEVTRYLGWPGQAISYKLGERAILAMRDKARMADGFDAKAFHSRVLGSGSMRLDMLEEVVLGDPGPGVSS